MTNANGTNQRERLLSRIVITPGTDCLLWTGGATSKGYGVVRFGGRVTGPYRAMYEMFVGPIPDGLVIDHLCRNPPCCNPLHLEPVTHAENMRRGVQATKTSCTHGHDFDGVNTRLLPNGGRRCRACAARRQREYLARRALAARQSP